MAKSQATPERKAAFLHVLSETCSVKRACEAIQISRATAFKWRQLDEEFAEAWNLASLVGASALEDEARHRAMEGVQRPVFYKGRVVGHVTDKSDALLMFMLKGSLPQRYADRQKMEIGGPQNEEMNEDQISSRIEALLTRARQRKLEAQASAPLELKASGSASEAVETEVGEDEALC